MTSIKARRKPIEVWAVRYNHSIVLEEFIKMLSENKNEPVRYDDETGTIYIQKERGDIALKRGNWVIYEMNTDQCYWAIDHEIFLKTYVKVSGHIYKKRSYEIEGMIFNKLEPKSILNVLQFMGYHTKNTLEDLQLYELIEDVLKRGSILVQTLEGVEHLYPGEIVIRGIDNDLYPVKMENFNKVYDLINDVKISA
jgi:hypothetical protein